MSIRPDQGEHVTIPAIERIRVVLADSTHARMFEGAISWPGGLRLEEGATIESAWRGFHETERPTLVPSGTGPARVVHLRSANAAGGSEEMERRFARDLARWIHDGTPGARAGTPTPRTAVFAPPRFLAHLREALGPIGDGVALFRGDFMRLRAEELAAHPSVRSLLGSTSAHPAGLGPRPR